MTARDVEFYEQHGDELPGDNPLDKIPSLRLRSRPVWAAFEYLLTYADGYGGVSTTALEHYLVEGPGRSLDPWTKADVRDLLPDLLREYRRLQAEEMERRFGKGRREGATDRPPEE